MVVVVEGVALPDVGRDAPDGEVHTRQLEGGVGVFLAIYAHVLHVAVMDLDELHRLHEHTARTAAGVVDLAVVGLDKLGDKVDYRLGCVVFALTFSLGDGELAKEIFIHAADKVVLGIGDGVQLVNFIQQRSELGLVQAEVGIVVVGQGTLQLLVLLLDVNERVVDNLEDIGLLGVLHDVRPAAFLG